MFCLGASGLGGGGSLGAGGLVGSSGQGANGLATNEMLVLFSLWLGLTKLV